VVQGTRHTRTGYTVGHYVLHTGRTGEATVRRRDDEAPVTYRRLLDPLEVVSCPTCQGTEVEKQLSTFAFTGTDGGGSGSTGGGCGCGRGGCGCGH